MLPLILKQTLEEIPQGVRRFVKRALIIMVSWLLVYHVVLKPLRIPDEWLTNRSTDVTVFFLNKWYSPKFFGQRKHYVGTSDKEVDLAFIMFNGKHVLGVADGCNALELFVLYIGFLLCMSTNIKRTLFFVAAGILMIFALNISRLYALTWLALTHPSFFDFAHHYAFTLVVYSCIFGLWVLYSKKYILYNEA